MASTGYWLRFTVPAFWHDDVLRGLDYLESNPIVASVRLLKPMIHRRRQSGAGRSTSFILNVPSHQHPFRSQFH